MSGEASALPHLTTVAGGTRTGTEESGFVLHTTVPAMKCPCQWTFMHWMKTTPVATAGSFCSVKKTHQSTEFITGYRRFTQLLHTSHLAEQDRLEMA
jgi:hypothetical protein